MRTTTKQYPIMCRECNGSGRLADQTATTNPYRTCPVCCGSGVVTLTETTIDDDWLNTVKQMTPKSIF